LRGDNVLEIRNIEIIPHPMGRELRMFGKVVR